MKIVQVSAIGMTQIKLLNTLNKESKNHGYDVHCVNTNDEYTKDILQKGFTFHPITIKRKIAPVSNLFSIFKMYRLFKRIKPDIVHVHTPIAAVLGRVAAKLAGVPNIIYTAHGFYFHEGMSDKAYKLFFNIEKYTGRYFTDYIFMQSEEDYELAVKNKFLSKKNNGNYLHISNGIDLENQFSYHNVNSKNIEALKNKLDINENDLVVSFIGRLVEEKGIFDLLESYKFLKAKNVKFIIIGSLPESERDTTSYNKIMEHSKNNNIIFTGQVTNTEEYLYMSDIFCLPSYREGMPRSIIEGMAMKNAIIATDIRGSREEVIDGKNGFLIKLNSSTEIAEKIDKLNRDNTLLTQMKEFSYNRAREMYNEREVVRKQLEVFDKLTKRG